MPNMTLTKVPMPTQEPNVRNKNFDEVALGTLLKWLWKKQQDVLTARINLV